MQAETVGPFTATETIPLRTDRNGCARAQPGKPMPSVSEVSRGLPMDQGIDDLILLTERSLENEWEGQVCYLPLR
jgi:hypothetical protein